MLRSVNICLSTHLNVSTHNMGLRQGQRPSAGVVAFSLGSNDVQLLGWVACRTFAVRFGSVVSLLRAVSASFCGCGEPYVKAATAT